MIRRLKVDVLKDLPPKRKIIIPLELDPIEEKYYRKADQEFIDWLKEHVKAGADAQVEVEKLKQLAYIAKRNSVLQWIEDQLTIGVKLVVFAWHTNAIKDLMWKFKDRAVMVDGSITGKKRDDAVEKFQNDAKIRLFVGQMKAAGEGIDLFAASAVVFVEFGWTPLDHTQAEDRINRIGQKSDSITAYYLIADGTVENDFMDMLEGKYDVVSQILDGKKDADLFDGGRKNLLGGVLAAYRRRI
jgi:SWI/SNF-related matrix-associated actin-dependent regulator of chromatin subfamily A-like protein 1